MFKTGKLKYNTLIFRPQNTSAISRHSYSHRENAFLGLLLISNKPWLMNRIEFNTASVPFYTPVSAVAERKMDYQLLYTCLESLMKDSYSLMLQTQYCHFNAKGKLKEAIQEATGHYEEIAATVDLLSSRLRALSHEVTGSFRIGQSPSLGNSYQTIPDDDMIKGLIIEEELLLDRLSEALSQTFECNDHLCSDAILSLITLHERYLWAYRSISE